MDHRQETRAGNLGFTRAGGRAQQGKMQGWRWADTQDQFLENPGPGTVTWGLWYPLCSDTLGEHCLPKLWSWSAMTLSREGPPWPYSPRDEIISHVTLQIWLHTWKDRQVEFSGRNKKKHTGDWEIVSHLAIFQPMRVHSGWLSGVFSLMPLLLCSSLFPCFLPFASVFRAHSSQGECFKAFPALSLLLGPQPGGEGPAGA